MEISKNKYPSVKISPFFWRRIEQIQFLASCPLEDCRDRLLGLHDLSHFYLALHYTTVNLQRIDDTSYHFNLLRSRYRIFLGIAINGTLVSQTASLTLVTMRLEIPIISWVWMIIVEPLMIGLVYFFFLLDLINPAIAGGVGIAVGMISWFGIFDLKRGLQKDIQKCLTIPDIY